MDNASAWMLAALAGAVALAACGDASAPGIGGFDPGSPPEGSTADAGTDGACEGGTLPGTPVTPSADASTTPPRGPDPACEVPEQAGGTLKLAYRPAAPIASEDIYVTATDADNAYTEIALHFCTPNGLIFDPSTTVDSGQKPYAWSWIARRLPLGTTQIQFVADPNMTVVATQRITVSK